MFFQICQPNGSVAHPVFPIDKTSSSYQQGRSDIPNGALSQCSVDTSDNSLCRSLGMQLPPLDGFAEYLNQVIIIIQDLTDLQRRKILHYQCINQTFLIMLFDFNNFISPVP